jgi:uncharacterized protein YdiU (UPF0061 family)
MMTAFSFENSYARLPERFFARTLPSEVRAPRLIRLNRALAEELGLDPAWLSGPEGVEVLTGNRIPDGAEPIATAYSGHQFGQFSPQLGDGRAILLGEVIDRQGRRRDIQLKGPGRTPFSRRGDGRAALGPVLREYIVSEAMAVLGIPTTRALAAALTGETVMREEPLPGAILTRVASSHIRVGTFQFFAARGDAEALRLLADHVIARHYPEVATRDAPYLALLEAVIAAQADLVAQWMLIGFIHGVMNTDNMSISGETIDYGPCAFMDAYDPKTVFSAIDEYGRYAFANQPPIARWNLTRLAETLLPLLSEDQDEAVSLAETALAGFAGAFETAFLAGMRRKLGLFTAEPGDVVLIKNLMDVMQRASADYTLTLRYLCDAAEDGDGDAQLRALFGDPGGLDAWLADWHQRLAQEPQTGAERRAAMRAVNPLFIPRNHRIEAVIEAAVERDDFAPFAELIAVLSAPYDDQPGLSHYALPPTAQERVLQTFCGT